MTKSSKKNRDPKQSGKICSQRASRNASGTVRSNTSPDEEANAAASGKPTKIESLTELLSALGGASISELAEATGWQTHSIRSAMSGALKRKGLTVASELVDGVRGYRIGAPE